MMSRASGSAKGQARTKAPACPPANESCALCAVAGECGGCTQLAVPYAEQLARKDERIATLFEGLVDASVMRPIIGMDDPLRYRNKVMSPFAPGRKLPVPKGAQRARDGRDGAGAEARRRRRLDREVLCGMYAARTHRLVPVDDCPIENAEARRIVLTVRDLMRSFCIPPYKETTRAGFLRHAVVRVGHASGEILVTLATNGDEFPNAKAFCRQLVKRHPAITTIVQNVNTRDTNVVLGQVEHTLYGPGFILDTLCGVRFRISSQSFYQVNSRQTEVLYRCAVEAANLAEHPVVIDAYCGTGTIGLVAAKSGAERVIGVESVESAVRDARQNARHNGIDNATFVAQDAAAFMRGLAQLGGDAESVRAFGGADFRSERTALLMDPPRAGASEQFVDAACALAPARIVYISCNPTTQVRDVRQLMERGGYRIESVQPVDMFPFTDHIECIVALSRG